MHLGLVIYGGLEILSGGYLYDRKLVEYLRRMGDEVEIVSLPWRSYPRHLADNYSKDLHRRLASGRWDILLQDELNHPSLFLLNRGLKTTASPPVLTIVHHLRCNERRPKWQNAFYRQIEKRYLNHVDGFIFNSQKTQAEVEAISPRAKKRPAVIANPAGNRFGEPLDASEVVRRSALPGPLRIIFVGNLIPRKGLFTLLKAMERIPRSACTLQVVGVGDTNYERRIHRRIERRALADRVELRGRLADAELAAALRDSHVLCVPSSYEGFGIVYLEAMGFGLPPIAGAAGAAAEVVSEGETGFLVTPEDANALAERLMLLASNRSRLCEMGLAAIRRFQAHPSWDETSKCIRDFLYQHLER